MSETNKVNGKIFNAGWENKSVLQIAEEARFILGEDISLEVIQLMITGRIIYHLKK